MQPGSFTDSRDGKEYKTVQIGAQTWMAMCYGNDLKNAEKYGRLYDWETALPGGLGYPDGSFYDVGSIGCWWSASEFDSDFAYFRFMGYDGDYADLDYNSEYCLSSVRCMKD